MPDTIESLTPLQLEILDVLWTRGRATSAEIREALEPRHGLALSTVATLLSRLEKRGVIAHRRAGRRYLFTPRITREDVRTTHLHGLTLRLFDGDPAALVDHLIRSERVSAGARLRIRRLFDVPGTTDA